ncbi:mast cell-expressed membrane protein 1 isoform X2 [Dromiciops gliroides]|uniref:mast cell-expressed membrane protein 1 isoform X2 n=2 Tax=Dromiciops gliroides TaxID=33562 RepID=UPI001CC798D5|nr:mast cell-expressed membrane protein 1 isoform X2 [Dromiciops gliroides]
MEGTDNVYINQGLSLKTKAKKKEAPKGAQRFEEDEPDYENISPTTRSQNSALEQQSMSIQQTPDASAPSNSPGLSSVHKSIQCLFLLVGLSFLLCIILLSLMLLKSSDFSMKLMGMKSEVWNVSGILQKEQDKSQLLEAEITNMKKINNENKIMVNSFRTDLKDKSKTLENLVSQVKRLEMAQQSGSNSNHDSTR